LLNCSDELKFPISIQVLAQANKSALTRLIFDAAVALKTREINK
jgi:hypothetical protein